MRSEAAIQFPRTGACAVVSQCPAPATVALLLPNAGFIHRSGPFRLHVHLARMAAKLGIPTIRFDQPGVGDAVAPAARPQLDLALQTLDDAEALTGAKQFVVGGLCSAADLGWQLALRDPRVKGLLLIDPMAQSDSFWFRWGQMQLALHRGPGATFDWLRRRLRRPIGANAAGNAALRDWVDPADAAPQMTQLVERDVRILSLYTGGAANYFTHRRQFAATYGPSAKSPNVSFEHWTDCDHLFYLPEHRERLVQRIAQWLASSFGGRA